MGRESQSLPLAEAGAVLVLAGDPEGGIRYEPGFIPAVVAGEWFAGLRDAVPWEHRQRPMYDRTVDIPRLLGAYRLDDPRPLPGPLRTIADAVIAHTGVPFNSVGLNYYRDGRDSVAPHNDKLHSLQAPHPIVLLSLGAPRRMVIRPKPVAGRTAPPSLRIDLAPGSLLTMSHASQVTHEHGVPKTKAPVGARISLAFRVRP